MSTTATAPLDTTTSAAASTPSRADGGPSVPTDGTATWRDVLTGAATGQLVMAGFMLASTVAFEHRFDPMPVVVGLIVGGGIALLRRGRGRAGVIYAGVVSLLLFLLVALFGGFAVLSRPESTFELILLGGLLVVTILGLVATPGALRHRAGRAAALAPWVAAAALTALVLVGVGAGVLTGSASRMPGDLTMKASNYEFSATTLEAHAGRVAVWVDNQDLSHHDFTIKGVVTQQLPGQKASRAVFDVDAGTYRFYCSLHPDMEGTLRVS
jgi:plastocyanin